MKCCICGTSCFKALLKRTNTKGSLTAGWMCADCMSKNEPELFKNTKEDESILEKEIDSIIQNN